MPNPGVAPPDYTTNTGKFRLLVNDTYSVPLVPPVAGQGDYVNFSDAEIAAYLAMETSIYRAAGLAFMSLASTAAQEAESIKDFDLQVDSRQKAEHLRAQAEWFYAEANRVDSESVDGFTIVRTGKRLTADELAELDSSEYDPADWIV